MCGGTCPGAAWKLPMPVPCCIPIPIPIPPYGCCIIPCPYPPPMGMPAPNGLAPPRCGAS